jgi:cytoskeletal protein CcmA (bactofilin family)
MKRPVLQLLVLTLLLPLVVATSWAGDGAHRSINGSITIAEGQTAGNVGTVNGDVRIGPNAKVGEAGTVNGDVRLESGATAAALETVNGSVEVRSNAKVEGEVSSVNGSLTFESGAEVAGTLSNVNGRIRIDGAKIKGRVRTVGGDVEIGAGSRLEGGILVEKPRNWGWGDSSSKRPPRVVIGPDAVVSGTLEFQRDVELYVSDKAKVGDVVGATPKKFSGERP